MLCNYFKIALRHVGREKGYSVINVLGLAIGMACCLLILLFVRDELSYDRFHEKGDRIVRVVRETSVMSPAPLGPALADDLPEVEAYVRFVEQSEVVVTGPGGDSFRETILAADSTIFDVFSFALVSGDPHRALRNPDEVLLTESLARKYFGEENPIGQPLTFDVGDEVTLTVGGILRDVPTTSHLSFGMLASFELVAQTSNRMENYRTNWLHTYLLLDQSSDARDVEAKLPAFFENRVGEPWSLYRIQELGDVHLHSAHLAYDIAPQGDIRQVILFTIVAGLILLIACINFVNLSTARSLRRAREVGVRKAMGARRVQLVAQFLGESVVMTVIATILTCGIILTSLPAFRSFIGKDLALYGPDAAFLAAAMGGLAVIVGLVAGSYPALLLSRYSPVRALRGWPGGSAAGSGLRRGLVVFQFAISIFLVVATLTIHQQIEYLRNARLGFEPEQTVVLEVGGALAGRHELVRSEIVRIPGVRGVSATATVPGRPVSDYGYRPEGWAEEDLPGFDTFFIDEIFIDLLEMNVVQGRNFDLRQASDSTGFLLNEAALAVVRNRLGNDWANPIGKQLDFYMPSSQGWEVRRSGPVIGIVEDFHYLSLHSTIDPLVMQMAPQIFSRLIVKVDADDIAGTMGRLEARWPDFAGSAPFEYSFLDASYDALYRSERRMGELAGVFGALALFVACLGLFGLATFMAERRTKEIGVRKVLGASVSSVVGLLSLDFVKLVGVAFLLAAPVAYLVLREWLSEFAYRIDLTAGVFLLGGIFAVVIALLTVSYQALRAATADPVDSLRYE